MDDLNDIEFLYRMFGFMGKDYFTRFINIIVNCEGRINSLSNCDLNCSECIYKQLLEYEVV